MNYLQRLEHWGDTHHPKYLDLLRMALGVFLCLKGIEFARDNMVLNELINRNVPFQSFLLILLGHYVIFAHIMGGFLLAVGLLTRFACLIQIPILLGAIIFINGEMTGHFSEVLLSIIVLGLLIYFLIIGSGPWSLDRSFEKGAEEK
ncbi:MAG TPA: DoxX family protein [Flavisolibacter sp.]|nr:DoxX family protein [Flavisolibacter sp.]